MYNRRPLAFTNRYLFPPVVPSSIPAFIGEQQFKIFFKKNMANFAGMVNNQADFDKFNQIHIAINSLETNRNSVNTNVHKTGYVCLPLHADSLDTPGVNTSPNFVYRVYGRDAKTPYCAVLNGLGNTFQELDKLYKVQIRLGNWTNSNGTIRLPQSLEELRLMEQDDRNTSEWSTVMMMKPISEPAYGIYKFLQEDEMLDKEPELRYNEIGTANFEYVGFYNTVYDVYEESGYKTHAGNERIVEYYYRLYDSTGKKLLSDSGPINLTEHERKNISHTFNYLTQDQERYIVEFGIKTENGFEGVKRYPIKAEYIVLEMSNAMVRVSEERAYARMKLQIQAKQVVLEPTLKPGSSEEMSKLEFVKDIGDPMYAGVSEADQAKIETTHAMVEGRVAASKSFYLSCPRDIWFIETKIAGLTPFKTREEALANPYIYMENEHLMENNIPYLTQVRLISYEKTVPGLGATTEIIVDPVTGIKSLKKVNNDKTTYVIEGVKTSFRRERGVNIEIAEQTVKKESVKRHNHSWTERVPVQNPDGSTGEKTATFDFDSRWQLKDITAQDVVYPLTADGSRVQTPLEADPVVKDTTRKAYVLTEPKPINPKQEYYVFLTNYMGGFGMEVLESKIYSTNPNNPLETIETDYITDNPVLQQFLSTKVIPPIE